MTKTPLENKVLNPWKSEACKCHAHANGHWFNELNICDGCGISWNKHQKEDKPCETSHRLTIAQKQKLHQQTRNIIPRYRIYWNSNMKNWTLQLKGKKQRSFNSAIVKGSTYIISKKIQAKVREQKRKQVHAWVEIDQADLNITDDTDSLTKLKLGNQVRYNPYINKNFHYTHNKRKAIEGSTLVLLKEGTMYEIET